MHGRTRAPRRTHKCVGTRGDGSWMELNEHVLRVVCGITGMACHRFSLLGPLAAAARLLLPVPGTTTATRSIPPLTFFNGIQLISLNLQQLGGSHCHLGHVTATV